MKNFELEKFYKYKMEFSKNMSKLNKQIEINKINLESVNEEDVEPCYTDKKSSSMMVCTSIICIKL